MKAFHLSDRQGRVVAFRQPPRLPQPGDVYVYKRHMISLAGVTYSPGDTLEIIERTDERPFGLNCSLGNLRVRCKAMVSIWTGIELMLIEDQIELLEAT